jgi:hypothetical protein
MKMIRLGRVLGDFNLQMPMQLHEDKFAAEHNGPGLSRNEAGSMNAALPDCMNDGELPD